MKKQFTLFLAGLTVTALLAGCGKQDNAVVSDETTTIASEAEETVHTENQTGETEILEEVEGEEISEETEEAAKDRIEIAEKVEEEIKEVEEKEEEQVAKPTETTKPQQSMQPAKPETKPVEKPAQPVKPETQPVEKPVQPVKPETKPEVKPETKPEVVTLTSSEVFSKVTGGMDFSNYMDLDSDLLRDYYGMDESLLEDYCVKLPMMSFQITEIGIFRVKDANDTSKIVDCINQRAKDVGHSLYPSLEETYEARVVSVKGNYVLFAIADNSASIESAFSSLIK